MDTSPEYVLMCKKAEEIQEKYEFKNGDYLHCDLKGVYIYSAWEDDDNHTCDIWLPRIDQLIELSGGGTDTLYDPRDFISTKDFKTPEQLWFAFVMQEKYGKSWTRTEWR